MSPDGAFLLLGSTQNIAESNMKLSSLLSGQAPPFEEEIDWLQPLYTSDRTGNYMEFASTVLVQPLLLEENPLFNLI